jgi:hypothetical protein
MRSPCRRAVRGRRGLEVFGRVVKGASARACRFDAAGRWRFAPRGRCLGRERHRGCFGRWFVPPDARPVGQRRPRPLRGLPALGSCARSAGRRRRRSARVPSPARSALAWPEASWTVALTTLAAQGGIAAEVSSSALSSRVMSCASVAASNDAVTAAMIDWGWLRRMTSSRRSAPRHPRNIRSTSQRTR